MHFLSYNNFGSLIVSLLELPLFFVVELSMEHFIKDILWEEERKLVLRLLCKNILFM